jgi:NADPH-dependent 2,4-dienoyl-CoA reductase/sulfur reductase-like enzyme
MEACCLRGVPKAAAAAGAALVDSTRISPRGGAFLAKRSVVLPARVAASKNDTLSSSSSDDDGAEDDAKNDAKKNDAKKKKKKKKIVVVGAGWGGWGAAKAVAESETASVVLLDGVPDPTGRTGTRATSGKPFEAGVRGFWKDYPNINHLVVRERRRRIAEVLLSSKSRRRHFFLFRLSVSLVYF